MPVILDQADYELWLDPGFTDITALAHMLKPYDASNMRSYPISSRINQVANDDPACALPTEIVEAQNRLF
jgi:putative SOS response-associated peptidase YedK